MEKKQEQFPEQQAPEKNTDRAFVKVNTDGSPAMEPEDPRKAEEENEDEEASRH